jgi:hypothetical protein
MASMRIVVRRAQPWVTWTTSKATPLQSRTRSIAKRTARLRRLLRRPSLQNPQFPLLDGEFDVLDNNTWSESPVAASQNR